ncbi:MAG TPA: hypothetical protein VG868_04620, partial [Casimicrobiaceae bacterium]|nr:hypothetical protein [Casimicrobiaceae bacterium]
ARDVPIFVLTSSRVEMRVQRVGWGTGRNRTTLTLEPLDEDSVARLLDALVPGMPADAASAIASQAQGIPLFVVETIRALIDQDVVIPRDGVYRLEGDVGRLTVPDSLHGLLAARLDALDGRARALVADAAVLGTSFPIEALVAVSGRSTDDVRTILADLVRREVFEISADRLSPQRGNYRFSHDMLRQVAYDTLSRHDRKTRHLAVAEHLRTTFASDGEEVADVIARHYLDAVAAVPDDPDVAELRERAATALIKAGERAARTGALASGGASFAQAAELTAAAGTSDAALAAATLWERAATTAIDGARWDVVVGYADRAAAGYAAAGERRSEARAQALAGRSLKLFGLFAEARERLAPALAVLSEDPDPDAVEAMLTMASIEIFAGSPDADRLTVEALAVSQTLGVPASVMASALTTRGIYLIFAGLPAEAVAYHREAARLAEQCGDLRTQARSLINLSDVLGRVDPRAALEPAVTAVEIVRRRGDRGGLGFALVNAVIAQVEVGEWDGAERMAMNAAERDGLDNDATRAILAWIAALRGDAVRAKALTDQLTDLEASEDSQDRASVGMVFAFIALAEHRLADAVTHARRALEHAEALSPST